jgi:hypothetical protein
VHWTEAAILASREPALPHAEVDALRRPVVRTTALRVLLGAALVAVFLAALAVARARDARPDPILPPGATGMIVLDLSASAGLQPEFGDLLRRVAAADEPTGVIAFSDVPYELVPPGTPGRDLAPMIRFFAEGSTANPWATFQTGTNLSSGLEAAREALERDGVERGAILLASDLEFFPEDVPRLTETLREMRADGVALRILALGARDEQRRFFERVVGPGIFVALGDAPRAAVAAESAGRFRLSEEGMPWLFVALALTLALLLVANERACARLRLPRPGEPE